MFDDEIIAVANDSAQADRLATESAVKECYEQHKAAWESWDKGEPVDHWVDEMGHCVSDMKMASGFITRCVQVC